MAATSVKVTAPASAVREFALANGVEVGGRGRFAKSLVDAFNAQSDVPYVEAGHRHTVEVTVTAKNHRKITRRVDRVEVREAAKAAGMKVGDRGRLPREAFERFVLGAL